MTILKIKKVRDVQDVNYNKEGDAAFDLRATDTWIVDLDNERKEITQDEYVLKPNERILVKTGIKIQYPKGYWGNIRDRSGLAMKHGIHTLGGVIDETYRGEIGVIIINLSKKPYTIKKNERIAQMIITPYENPEIEYTQELENTERGENGFGQSGKS